ncbi:PTS system, mannose-specific IIA component [Granulicatella balaenopterae]|uniref:PTS system, mannose-specific IIA component n=1 Tax=Granulicatella balaenopterae TaxID=137733 RepID=A0A1H9P4C2_9LACT|nr:PTS fructose transporter subunit IIA [Granulicatella balaenopterae]SER43050.1 PTS system, mannose-specific IIA component [Granulicatella balaenopterae]
MLGIVIVTHGSLSEGLKSAAEVIIGGTNNMVTESLFQGDDVQALGAKITKAIEQVDQGDGVIVFTDIASASPYNQSLLAVNQLDAEKQKQIAIIAGVNLPMLLEGINHQLLSTPITAIPAAIMSQAGVSFDYWTVDKRVEDEEDEDDGF